MITYPVDTTKRYSIYSILAGGLAKTDIPWPRHDGAEILGKDPDLVFLLDVDVPPSYNPLTHEIAAGEWDVDLDAQTRTREYTISELESRKIWKTIADFWNEFTLPSQSGMGEQYAIQLSTDPAIIIARGQLAMWRGEVWSDDPRVTGALDALVTATILTAERKTQILSK